MCVLEGVYEFDLAQSDHRETCKQLLLTISSNNSFSHMVMMITIVVSLLTSTLIQYTSLRRMIKYLFIFFILIGWEIYILLQSDNRHTRIGDVRANENLVKQWQLCLSTNG